MRLLVMIAGIVGLAGCASAELLNRSAGYGGEPKVGVPLGNVPVHGFKVAVRFASPAGDAVEVTGELLAVDAHSLWVKQGDEPQPILRAAIDAVWLELYDSSGAGAFTAWAVLGQLGGISHGLLFIFSAPIWSLLSAPSIITAALANDLKVPLDRLGELSQFSRFPAGMPPPWGMLEAAPRVDPAPRPGPAAKPASRPAASPASRPVPRMPPGADEPGITSP